MAVSNGDLEEYLVRKTIDAGFTDPTLVDIGRIRFNVDLTDEVAINNYLESKRDSETEEDYSNLLDLIQSIRNEAGV